VISTQLWILQLLWGVKLCFIVEIICMLYPRRLMISMPATASQSEESPTACQPFVLTETIFLLFLQLRRWREKW
jgi:hypothetical protein